MGEKVGIAMEILGVALLIVCFATLVIVDGVNQTIRPIMAVYERIDGLFFIGLGLFIVGIKVAFLLQD